MNKFSKVKVGEQIVLRRKSFTVVAIFEDLGKTYYVVVAIEVMDVSNINIYYSIIMASGVSIYNYKVMIKL